MSEVGADWLPPARINCHKGRIRVGDRNFLSASEALAVYLRQFDMEQQQAAGCSPVVHNIRDDSSLHIGSFHAGSPVFLDGASPGSVPYGLADSLPGNGLKITGSNNNFPPTLNGEFMPHYDSKLSMNLPEQDHLSSFPLQCMKQPGSVSSLQDLSGMNGFLQHHTKPLYDHPYSLPLSSHQLGNSRYVDMHEPPQQLKPTTSYTDFSSSYKQSNTLAPCAPPELNGLTKNGFGNGTMEYLDFHVSAGANKKGTDLVFTAMPSQRELKELAEDALREAKMKRLLKVVKPASSPSVTSDKSHVLCDAAFSNRSHVPCEAAFSKAGEQSRTGASKENHQVKGDLMETKEQELSYLQQEVNEALSRSAQLLEDLKPSKASKKPGLACDVNSHHSADILLSTTTTPTNDPQTPSSRASRSRHRYAYRSQPAHVRSLSLDGGHHRSEACSSAEALSPSRNNPRSSSLADNKKFRSMENLKISALDDLGPYCSADCLKVFGDDTQQFPSRDGPKPASLARLQQLRLSEDQVKPSLHDFDQLPSRDCLKSSDKEDSHQLSPLDDVKPLYTGVGDRELQYLKKGTSVMSDCEDLLRELQAVNPPPLPDLSFHRRRSWSAQSSGQTPITTLMRTDKAERDHMDSSSDFLCSRMVPVKDSTISKPIHTQDLSGDTVSLAGLKRTLSVPCVNSLGRSLEKTADDSSFADFSYMGPGLSFSDLVTTSMGSSKHIPPANAHAELPPKHPHRRSKTGPGKGSELNTGVVTKNRSRSPTTSNPVLENVADILDDIDQNLAWTETQLTVAPEALRLQPADHKPVMENGADADRFLKGVPGPTGREDTEAAESREGQRGQLQSSQLASLALDHGATSMECPVTSVGTVGGEQPALRKSQTVQEEKEKDEAADLLPALKGYRYELEPGGHSLEKALVHLGRLKTLVQIPPADHHAGTSGTSSDSAHEPQSSVLQQLPSSPGARPKLK